MFPHFCRFIMGLGLVALSACDMGDLSGPKPPPYFETEYFPPLPEPEPELTLDSTNLITNSGFESSLAGWDCFTIEGGQAQFSLSDVAYSGLYSLNANIRIVGSNFWSIQAAWDPLFLENGEKYNVSLWVKSPSDTSAFIVMASMNHDPYSNYGSDKFYPSDTWQQFSYDFTAASNATSGSKLAIMFSNLGEYWIDDVMVLKYVEVE